MTENTTTEDTQPEEVAPQTEPETDPAISEVRNSEDDPEPQSKREARYRTQLREAEAQRDHLAATVEALQRAEVERLAANVIEKPTSIWATQTALSELLDDTGNVDPQKVTEAAKQARQDLGLTRPVKGPVVPKEGTSIHKSTPANDPWQSAFKG